MHTNPMIPTLKSLKLYGMAHALSDLAEQDSPAFQASTGILDHLLKAELAEREVRSVAYQLKTAKFPAYRDLNGFDFASSMANEALIRQLCGGDFMDTAQNVVFVGGPGRALWKANGHCDVELGIIGLVDACDVAVDYGEGDETLRHHLD